MFDLLLGASGGIVGVVGALVKHGLEIWSAKKKAENDLLVLQEQNRHEQLMADKQRDLIELEAKNAVALAEVNRLKETDVAAYGALSASLQSDRASYSNAPTSPWMIAVDVARGFIRPVTTIYFTLALTIFTAWILYYVPHSVVMTADFLTNTFYRLVDALIFLTTSCTGWWFAARGITKGEGGRA
jgi:endonuclease/exonuclease/phosphatase (EEP) superfamily protein YafD